MILPTQPTPPTISQAHKEIDKKMYKFFLVASLKNWRGFLDLPSNLLPLSYYYNHLLLFSNNKKPAQYWLQFIENKNQLFSEKKIKKWQRVSVWYNLFVCSKNWNESKKKNRQKKKTLSIKMKKKKNNSKMQKGKNICFFFQFFTSWKLLCFREKDVVLMKNNNEKQILMSFLFVLQKIWKKSRQSSQKFSHSLPTKNDDVKK